VSPITAHDTALQSPEARERAVVAANQALDRIRKLFINQRHIDTLREVLDQQLVATIIEHWKGILPITIEAIAEKAKVTRPQAAAVLAALIANPDFLPAAARANQTTLEPDRVEGVSNAFDQAQQIDHDLEEHLHDLGGEGGA
jgi:hypothetical protein